MGAGWVFVQWPIVSVPIVSASEFDWLATKHARKQRPTNRLTCHKVSMSPQSFDFAIGIFHQETRAMTHAALYPEFQTRTRTHTSPYDTKANAAG